jgi:hypothetical protein
VPAAEFSASRAARAVDVVDRFSFDEAGDPVDELLAVHLFG